MANEKNEQLKALKEMARLDSKIDKLYEQKYEYEAYMEQTDIDDDDYPTDNKERTEEEEWQVAYDAKASIQSTKYHNWLLLAGILTSVVLLFLGVSFPLVAAFFVVILIARIICRKAENRATDKKKSEIDDLVSAEFAEKINAAEQKDEENEAAYLAAIEAELVRRAEETKPKLEKLEAEIAEAEAAYEQIQVLSDEALREDPDLVSKMIRLMERGRADSIKECYKLIDEENERNRRQKEEEHRREEERRRNSPGELYVYVGERLNSSYKVPRNQITIDGQDYGPGSIPYKKIVLQPGWHTISVVSQYTSSTLHYSDTIQFEMEGGSQKFFQFYDKGTFPPMLHVKECACEADMHKDPY